MQYKVITAKEAARLSPNFSVPAQEAIRMLRPGNMVRFVVDFVNKNTGRPQAEPLWGGILTQNKSKMVVVVWDNPPPKKSLHHNIWAKTKVNITTDNIVDVMFEAPKTKKEFTIPIGTVAKPQSNLDQIKDDLG